MTTHLPLARRYRPQTFADVLGQAPSVTIIKNAIREKRLANAYLFSGPRGTGKTTLARLFAKALNCPARSDACEPCGTCASCREIASGHSLDVLEIDGASHRGIDDIRTINETVGYSTSSGGYKIYIIDEVHMLTKEAFNALLKTLEEPPERVLFFFATTEPHKVLPTILSRCQRFNLNRIANETIIKKLLFIASEMKITLDPAAADLIAARSEGALRDAESLFDQILAFHGQDISVDDVAGALGIMPRDTLFALDQAGKEGDLSAAFRIADTIFSEGKDIVHFIETLTDHFRTLLLLKLSCDNLLAGSLSPEMIAKYRASESLYTKEQCLTLIDTLVEEQQKIRFAPSPRIALETILLRCLRSFHRVPIEFLVRKLTELEERLGTESPPKAAPKLEERLDTESPPKAVPKIEKAPPPKPSPKIEKESAPIDLGARPTPQAAAAKVQNQSRYDTLLQFTAVELNGHLQKH